MASAKLLYEVRNGMRSTEVEENGEKFVMVRIPMEVLESLPIDERKAIQDMSPWKTAYYWIIKIPADDLRSFHDCFYRKWR